MTNMNSMKSYFSKIVVLLALCVSIVMIFSTTSAIAQSFNVASVIIDGNKRIETATIKSYAAIPEGQVVDASELNAAYKRLLDSGLFERVTLTPRGSSILIEVREYPTINQVAFEGNARIDDAALASAVRSRQRLVLNPQTVEQDRLAIAETYANAGRLAARVTPKIIQRSENRVDLVFEIFEGGVVEVERIGFVGNKLFSDRRLHRVLETKQAGILRAFIRSDTFVEDRIEFDKQVLSDFYQSRGYVDFRINSVNAELTEERDGYFITFNIREGQQFRVGNVSLNSDLSDVNIEEFSKIIKLKSGDIYTPGEIDYNIDRLERFGLRKGVDFIRVTPSISRNDADLTLDVNFMIERGPRVFVERINVSGNTATLDRVIRRQFLIAEGDPFSPREIRNAAERIRALGFFSKADVNAREGSRGDQVIVDVQVEEQPTGNIALGASYSASAGFGLLLEYGEKNFLGRGQDIRLKYNSVVGSKTYSIDFTEPQFLNPNLSFGISAAYTETEKQNSNYDTTRVNVIPSLSFPVSENGRVALRYSNNQTDLKNPSNIGEIITQEVLAGKQRTSSVGYTYAYDTRRSGLDPNRGVLLRFSQDFSGLGGDVNSIKTTALMSYQANVWNEEVVLRATIEGGVIDHREGVNRVADRFFLSSNMMRGFKPGGIGPREKSGNINDALGGNTYAAARFEAEFPLGLPEEYGIEGGVFYDIGNLWSLEKTNANVLYEQGAWRHVIGASIFWETPVGPLRFNFTKALQKETHDEEQTFDLTIRTQF